MKAILFLCANSMYIMGDGRIYFIPLVREKVTKEAMLSSLRIMELFEGPYEAKHNVDMVGLGKKEDVVTARPKRNRQLCLRRSKNRCGVEGKNDTSSNIKKNQVDEKVPSGGILSHVSAPAGEIGVGASLERKGALSRRWRPWESRWRDEE